MRVCGFIPSDVRVDAERPHPCSCLRGGAYFDKRPVNEISSPPRRPYSGSRRQGEAMANGISRAGTFVEQGDGYRAFVPAPLPPDPPVEVDAEMLAVLSDADLALGRLDGVIQTVPNPDLFVAMYVRREAVLSSQIEGTQSTLEDLLAVELEPQAAGVSRRRRGSRQLRAGDESRARAPVFAAALTATHPGDPRRADAQRTRIAPHAGRVPAEPELDRPGGRADRRRRRSCRRPCPRCARRSTTSSASSTTRSSRSWSTSALPTRSSRRSIRSSTATAASVGC